MKTVRKQQLVHGTPPCQPLRIALVNMPFALADRPSIQCGLLKAALVRDGHRVDVHYPNTELSALLGPRRYETLATVRTEQLVGDWLFGVAAFGTVGDEDGYRIACPGIDDTCRRLGMSFEDLCRLRKQTLPEIVDRWATETDWSFYRIVGFTSTFEQNVAALALARRIKAMHADVTTIFGGANFDGEMGPEYVRAFPWIDCAVVGEGDLVVRELVARVARNEPVHGLPGVYARVDEGIKGSGEAPLVHDMDTLPDPDYDEYFAAIDRLGPLRVLGLQPPTLPFESARGCWWGAKHHCTFCGLNRNGMAFRAKSPAAAAGQVRRLADRYDITRLQAVDNILDMRYIGGFCDELASDGREYSIFYEVKANLTREQLRRLRIAGITSIQPGIESLSSHLLDVMRKGSTMLTNVRLLRWALYYGIDVVWNLLAGFPGERKGDYDEQARIFPLLRHLQPPKSCGTLYLERFSPHYFDPSFPIREVRSRRAYQFLYPVDSVNLNKVAYYFDYKMDDLYPDAHASLFAAANEWTEAWRSSPRPSLTFERAGKDLLVRDARTAYPAIATRLRGAEAAAYQFCSDTACAAGRVGEHLASLGFAEDAGVVLEGLCERGLAVGEDGRYLSLAVPAV